MKTVPKISFTAILAILVLASSCRQGQKPEAEDSTPLKKGVILVDYREKNKVDVFIDGDIFTSYIYPENLEKPVLFPVCSAEGTTLTRGWPLMPRSGERVDHPHQAGVWFNFGDVNGYDFWNNSYAVPADKKSGYGRVLHRGVKRAESRETLGLLEIAADWQVPAGDDWHTVLQENTVFEFSGDEKTRTIDRITRLTAQEKEVVFTDNKEGLFAIRVARGLETPSEKPVILTDAEGKPSAEKTVSTEGVNGSYLSSEGLEGEDTWGKPARWVLLKSRIGEEDLGIALFDYPGNPGFPARSFTRGYGLFGVNNLGAKAYDENAEPITVRLMPGESIVFKHRMYITSGYHPTAKQLDGIFEEFSGK